MSAGAAVVTLNYNGRGFLGAMMRSVAPQLGECDARFVLFDNCSTDGSFEAAREEFGPAERFSFMRSDRNLGFAGGANAALAGVTEPVAVLANSDTVFGPGSLEALLAGLERHPRAGLAAPRLLWPDGTLQRSMRDFPFPGRLLVEHLPLLRACSARYSDHCTERRADWLVGAVMALRMGAFREIGGFDESYFFYHEETDLQYRLHRAGWERWLVPASEVVHIEGGSASAVYGRETTLRYIPAKLRFLRKHGSRLDLAAFRVMMSAMHLGRAAAGLVLPGRARGDVRFTRRYCAGALAALWADGAGPRKGSTCP